MILIAAVLIGVVASFGIYQYIQKVEEDAKPNPVQVYVLTADIERGTPFSEAQAAIASKTIPAEFRPANFVTNLAELENKVAVTNLAANQVLVQNMFVSADVAMTSFRDRIEGDLVAVALPIDGVRAVGGLLQPGDEVNIIWAPSEMREALPEDPLTSPYPRPARHIYQKVRILSVGSIVRPVAGEPVPEGDGTTEANASGTIVVEVPAEVAQRLVALDPAELHLTLIPDTWSPRQLAPISPEEFGGAVTPAEDPAQLTPYGPAGYTPASAN